MGFVDQWCDQSTHVVLVLEQNDQKIQDRHL